MNKLSVITGATGHIGYALLQELLAQGEKPRLLLLGPDPIVENLGCEIIIGDITNPESLRRAFEGAHTVYHLAGLIEVGDGDEDAVWRVNVDGTQNVVAVCKACGVKRLVYCSSVDAMPPAPEGKIMTEPERFSYGTVSGGYARSKAVATQAVLNSGGTDFEVMVCMPSACIGPYDFKVSNVGVMVRLFLKFPFPFTMHFGGYNFVDVRDVAKGLVACAAQGQPGESYLLTGEYMDTNSFIAALAELSGHEPPALPLPRKLADLSAPLAEQYYKLLHKTPLFTRYSIRKIMENGRFNYEKASRELGYAPRSARDSLEDMINWIRLHEKKENNG